MRYIITIKGKRYEIHLEERKLVNIDNPREVRKILEEDIAHFSEIIENLK